MPLTLIAENVSLERGGRRLLAGLSFSVAAGEALLVTGPNGAGKTTLVRAVAGHIAPATGSIRLEGASGERRLGEYCHAIGHANATKPAMTVAENVDFWARFLGGDPGRTTAALERLGLAALADIPAGYLSAGQKRRLGLARLLVAERPIWLLDEPTVSLDSRSVGLLAEAIGAHRAAGGMVMAATHLDLGLAGARELHIGPSRRHEAGD